MSGEAMTCAVVVVELRGFEPPTPGMPSRGPRHSAHHKSLGSRPLPAEQEGSRVEQVESNRARRDDPAL